MAKILIHQPVHRSANIRIHHPKCPTNDNLLPMAHSVDEILFFSKQDSTSSLFQFFQRYTSEPQIVECQSASLPVRTDQFLHKPSVPCIPAMEFNCDLIEPVKTDEEVLLSDNTEPSIRRRKRRTSFTRLSSSSDENQPVVTNPDAKSERILFANQSITPVSRYRTRKWRQRLCHRPITISEEEFAADISVQFYVPSVFTPPPSPTSPTGSLKRTGSVGNSKKIVRFADSIGRELTQVQYIPSCTNNDSQEVSLIKGDLYVSTLVNFERKPWSFDVAQSSRHTSDIVKPKRFFCLFRQPDSEHPDSYLHQVWRSQIKLQHADIRRDFCATSGEQYLDGTLSVTNASYYKYVTVKYTFNQWANTCEYEARHRCHSNDFRNIDQFEFSIEIPIDVDRIDFVLRYCVNEQQYWDNNEGNNYTLQSELTSTPQTTISLPHDCDFNEMRFY